MFSALVAILAQAVTFGVGDRTEVRTRIADRADYDAENRLIVLMTMRTPRAAYSLTYSPTVTVMSIGRPEQDVTVFHTASARAGYGFRHAFVGVSETLGYGSRNTQILPLAGTGPEAAPLPAQAPPDTGQQPPADGGAPTAGTGAPTPAPSAAPTPAAAPPEALRARNQVLVFGSSTTALDVTHVLSSRTTFAESVGYTVTGGLDASSKEVFPIQKGPFGRLAFGYQSSRRDRWSTIGDGLLVDSSPNGALAAAALNGATKTTTVIVGAEERWGHRWSKVMLTELGGGAAYSDFDTNRTPPMRVVYPVADATLTQAYLSGGTQWAASYSLRLAPFIDRTTGAVDQRVQAAASFSWSRNFWSLVATVWGLRSVDGNSQSSISSAGGGLTAARALGPAFRFELGVRSAWQTYQGAETLPLTWSAFAALAWMMPPTAL